MRTGRIVLSVLLVGSLCSGVMYGWMAVIPAKAHAWSKAAADEAEAEYTTQKAILEVTTPIENVNYNTHCTTKVAIDYEMGFFEDYFSYADNHDGNAWGEYLKVPTPNYIEAFNQWNHGMSDLSTAEIYADAAWDDVDACAATNKNCPHYDPGPPPE